MNRPNCAGFGKFGLTPSTEPFGVPLPPAAQRGLEYTLTIGEIPRARSPCMMRSARVHWYAGSLGSPGLTGFVGAIADQRRSTRVTRAPVAATRLSRASIASAG